MRTILSKILRYCIDAGGAIIGEHDVDAGFTSVVSTFSLCTIPDAGAALLEVPASSLLVVTSTSSSTGPRPTPESSAVSIG